MTECDSGNTHECMFTGLHPSQHRKCVWVWNDLSVVLQRWTEVKDPGLLPCVASFQHVCSFSVVTIVTWERQGERHMLGVMGTWLKTSKLSCAHFQPVWPPPPPSYSRYRHMNPFLFLFFYGWGCQRVLRGWTTKWFRSHIKWKNAPQSLLCQCLLLYALLLIMISHQHPKTNLLAASGSIC